MKDENIIKVSKVRQKKEKIVAKLSEKVDKAKAIVFTDYQGLTHVQLEQLKKAVKKTNADYVVTKNTLLQLALKQTQNTKLKTQNDKDNKLDKPTATLFIYDDIVAPLKELAKIIKSLKLPAIKFGILDGKMLLEKDVLKLSTLPSREVLLAQLVGGLKSPIYGLHRALNWNLQKFIMTLRAISDKKKVTS